LTEREEERVYLPLVGFREVAFLGRSNVGKSSTSQQTYQMFTQASTLESAVVGKTPGATASVNLYTLERKQSMKPLMGFVDLPGFGYARLSKDTKESVETAAERYLGKRKELALGILLVDIRRIPSDDDRAVLAALYDMGVPIVVVATKKDKISSRNQLLSQMEEVRVGLGLPIGQPLCISSKTGEGVKQLWGIIMDACEDRVLELREGIEKGAKVGAVSDEEPESYGTIQLDKEGRFMEEDEQDVGMEGYEWVQNFQYYDIDDTDEKEKEKKSMEVLVRKLEQR
jgi:ribosome biogenesis GTP-binding protein YsxC/EngB